MNFRIIIHDMHRCVVFKQLYASELYKDQISIINLMMMVTPVFAINNYIVFDSTQ